MSNQYEVVQCPCCHGENAWVSYKYENGECPVCWEGWLYLHQDITIKLNK